MIYLCIHVDITRTIITALPSPSLPLPSLSSLLSPLSSLLQAHAHAVVLSLVRNMAAIIKRDASDQVSGILDNTTILTPSHPLTLSPSHPLTLSRLHRSFLS